MSRLLVATSGAGQELMDIWNDLEIGAVKHEQAHEQSDQAMKRKCAAAGEV